MNSISAAGRPRRWWVAFLLNFFLPPAGYAYVRAWRYVAFFLLFVLITGIGLISWSFAHPSGLFGWDLAGAYGLGLLLSLMLGLHAAWISRKAPTVVGPRLQHIISYVVLGMCTYVIAFGERAFWPQSAYSIASASMEPTLRKGDVVGVKGARALCGKDRPTQGDVVAYRRPGLQTRYMHRLVAGPGDTVEVRRGRLVINDAELKIAPVSAPSSIGEKDRAFAETFPNGAVHNILNTSTDGPFDNVRPIRLSTDMWYALGDNRSNAVDSRFNGPVRSSDICGVGFVVLFSKDKSRVGRKP